MGYLVHEFQLKSHVTGEAIIAAGGVAVVLTAGDSAKATLYDPDSDFASLANPISLTRGAAKFAVADTVNSVDIAIMAPGGQFLFLSGVKARAKAEYAIDTNQKFQVAKIPFSHDDSTAATEQDTGFDLPTDALVLPNGIAVEVVDVDATETIDVGILSSESGGDADGFLDGISVATAGLIQPAATITTGTNNTYLASTTLGALLRDLVAGEDTAAGGDGTINAKPHRGDGTAKSISYTSSAGSDTLAGFIHLPYLLK